MHSMRKGENVTVYSDNGKGINCPIVDIDYGTDTLFVRLPTNQVIEMKYDKKQQKYVGRFARLEFTVLKD